MSDQSSATPKPETPRKILVGPGHLNTMIRQAEEVLNSLGKYFIDSSGARDGLVVKVEPRRGFVTFARASRETIICDLDSHATFFTDRQRIVHVPRELPAYILRRALLERSDVPFPNWKQVAR